MSEEETKPVSWWVGRRVRRVDTDEGNALGAAIVLAVDDTAYRPSAWIKYDTREHPSYRTLDLCELQDIETEAYGVAWGTGGPDKAMADSARHYEADGITPRRPSPSNGD